MALAMYRRHRRDCKAGHKEELRTSEYDERKKGWERCECPIFVSGTLQGTFKRQTTGQWEWDAARPIVASYEAMGTTTNLRAIGFVLSDEEVDREIRLQDAVNAASKALSGDRGDKLWAEMMKQKLGR